MSKVGKGHIYKYGKGFEKVSKIKLGDYRQFKQVFKREVKSGVKVTDNFKGWKGATKFDKFGKGLGLVSTGLTIQGNFSKNFKDGMDGESVKNFVIDTSVDIGSGAAASATGAAFGSLILPPLGTVVGAGLGIAFNYGLNEFKVGNPPKSTVEHIKSGIKDGFNKVGKLFSHKFW